MNIIFKQEIIDYDYVNNNKDTTILFLHGWGGNKFSFSKSIEFLHTKYNILTITMPTILDTKEVWNLCDYSDLVEQLISLINLKKIIVICHSFGLRVLLLLKDKIQIEKAIITGGAGLKKIDPISRIIRNEKIIKNKKTMQNFDYFSLSKTNRETFKNIVNFNLFNFIKFPFPLLLFYGKKDRETKMWIAKKLKSKNNANLIKTNGTHFSYLENSSEFNRYIKEFLCF